LFEITINTFDWDATNGGTLYHCNAAMGGSDSGSTYIPANSPLPSFYQEEGGLFSAGASSFELKHSTFKMMLHTGGKSGVGKQGLFQLTAGATEEIPVPSMGYYHQAGIVDGDGIPCDQITIDGEKLDTNGIVWKVYPDGKAIDVTPRANAPLYSFGVSQQKFTPVIQVNHAVTLEPDEVVDGATNFWVGQELTFSAGFDPALPENPEIGPFKWVFQGTYKNDSVQPYSNGSVNYFVNSDKLANPSTTAWWVAGQNSQQLVSQLNVGFGEGLTFANGQYVAIAAHGLFNMIRPQATVTAVTKAVAVDTNFDDNGTHGVFALHYGTSELLILSGIELSRTVNPLGCGTLEWVQVLNHTAGHVQHSNGTWVSGYTKDDLYDVLDADPYAPSDSNGSMGDSPGIGGNQFSDLSLTKDFNAGTWLMFTPSEGRRVPLKMVNWYWSGTAVRSGTNWTLTAQNNNANPPSIDTVVYPQWTNNVGSFK
jgi:hypothetical protein